MATASSALRLLILGPPGSGKGTICKRIVDTYLLQHLSSGDALRSHVAKETALGIKVKSFLETGSLVPDEIITQLMISEIRDVPNGQGWILDGFPRTLIQAQDLSRQESIRSTLYLNVPFETIIDRVKDRLVHLPSGRIYNHSYNQPKVPGKDDITGEPLEQRPDDNPQAVLTRLQHYQDKTEPLLKFYKERNLLVTFSGTESDVIWPQVKKYIDSITVR